MRWLKIIDSVTNGAGYIFRRLSGVNVLKRSLTTCGAGTGAIMDSWQMMGELYVSTDAEIDDPVPRPDSVLAYSPKTFGTETFVPQHAAAP
jgi:hypothetical protein